MSELSSLTQPKRLGDLLLYRLYQIQVRAGSLVASLCENEFGITYREWRVICSVADNDGALSSELAISSSLDRVRTSRAVTQLAGKKLVERWPRPGNRREVQVYLSPSGRTLYEAAFPRVAAINLHLMDTFSEAQLADLESVIFKLEVNSRRRSRPA
jgi:DNA-binding MarR family transcriptional regulator